MRTSSVAFVALLLPSIAFAAPRFDGRSFKSGAKSASKSKGLSASLLALKTEAIWIQNKHEKTCPVGNSAGSGKQQSQSLIGHSNTIKRALSQDRPTTSYDNKAGYMVWIDLMIGSRKSKIPVMVDTGSPDISIPLGECDRCSKPRFHEMASTTFRETAQDIELAFADGCSITGFAAFETISYSPPGTKNVLTAEDQVFLAITDDETPHSRSGTTGAWRGFFGNLGLDFDTSSQVSDEIHFLDNLLISDQIDRRYFSMYFAEPDSHGNERSSICFGCIDQTKIITESAEDIVYTELVGEQDSWTILCDGFYVGNTNVPSTRNFNAFIDSGASIIYVSTEIAETFYMDINGSERYDQEIFTFPCDKELPLLFIGFGSTQYLLDPKYFNLGPVEEGSNKCVGAVWDREIDGSAVIGGAFLRDKVVVFEQDKLRIGIVPAKPVS